MSKILTHMEIEEVWVEHGLDECGIHRFTRAIESAILAKLNSAEPIAFCNPNTGMLYYATHTTFDVSESVNVPHIPLFTHPPAPSAVRQLQAQLESEKVSHEAWEKQSLLEYSEVVQERDALKYEWEAACKLVAEMHKAAVGDYQGCTNGVVEDIADLKVERDALRDALEEIADDYADRFDLESQSTNPGIKYVIAQARSALAKVKGNQP